MLKKYDVLYVDPPWEYDDRAGAGERGAAYKYPVMSIEEIQKLEMWRLAADDCMLFLWVTPPMLEDGFKIVREWGFKYKTVAFTWVKTTKKGKEWHWGMGHYTRANAEFCLLGVRGKPKRVSASVHSVIKAPVRAHSQKPDEVRDRIVQLTGENKNRLEVFARQEFPGWDVVGYDVNSLDIRELLEKYKE